MSQSTISEPSVSSSLVPPPLNLPPDYDSIFEELKAAGRITDEVELEIKATTLYDCRLKRYHLQVK